MDAVVDQLTTRIFTTLLPHKAVEGYDHALLTFEPRDIANGCQRILQAGAHTGQVRAVLRQELQGFRFSAGHQARSRTISAPQAFSFASTRS